MRPTLPTIPEYVRNEVVTPHETAVIEKGLFADLAELLESMIRAFLQNILP